MKSNLSTRILFMLMLCAANIQQGSAQFAVADIDTLINREVTNKRGASIVVGLLDKKGRHVIGYGRVKDDNSQSPDGNTVYEIGSISKVFTGLLLADMVLKHEVTLDDPISKFLPSTVTVPTRNGKEITLLDLATQTSGLPRMPSNFHPKDPANPYVDYSVTQMYDFISGYTLTRDIGLTYEYSNLGVGLLGHILSLVAKTDYETLVKNRICIPLHMFNTGITLTPALTDNLATGHDAGGRPVSNWDLPTFAGAGAIRSTVNDMLNFAAANLGMMKTKLDAAIALSHTIQRSTTIPDVSIAMNWHVLKRFDQTIYWHNGGTGGYRTYLGLDKDQKKAVIVFCSSNNSVDDIGLSILNDHYKVKPFSINSF